MKRFSLVELMVVLAIIAILGALIVPALNKAQKEKEQEQEQTEAKKVITRETNNHGQGFSIVDVARGDGDLDEWISKHPERRIVKFQITERLDIVILWEIPVEVQAEITNL